MVRTVVTVPGAGAGRVCVARPARPVTAAPPHSHLTAAGGSASTVQENETLRPGVTVRLAVAGERRGRQASCPGSSAATSLPASRAGVAHCSSTRLGSAARSAQSRSRRSRQSHRHGLRSSHNSRERGNTSSGCSTATSAFPPSQMRSSPAGPAKAPAASCRISQSLQHKLHSPGWASTYTAVCILCIVYSV